MGYRRTKRQEARVDIMTAILTFLILASPAIANAQNSSGIPPSPPGSVGTNLPLSASPSQGAVPPVVQQPAEVPSPPSIDPCAHAIPSAPIPSAYIALTVTVAKCTVPPKIDGNLDDLCWRTATHVVGFYPYATEVPITAANQTEAWICADATHLYVAFHCLQTTRIVAAQTQRNGNIGKDDFVGFDVDSQYRHRSFSTFLSNPAGVQFEALEGGTAQNITWAGDWTAAGKTTKDGYTVEIAVPFALLRYPKGSHAFGILLYRAISGKTGLESWPYTPMNATGGDVEAQFMAEITDMTLPYYAPRPTFLPYTLATTGDGSSVRNGLDIKYPLSTTLTGVASLYPDLDTIEQNVESIQFSYDQLLLTDNRPFFAEGSSYLPDNDLFYSRTIGQFDQGIKLVGKDADTSIGLLGTNYSGATSQSETAMNLRQDFGPYRDLGFEYVDDIASGTPSNQVGRVYGGYSWTEPNEQYSFYAAHAQSYDRGTKADGDDSLTFQNSQGELNRPYFALQYLDIGPNFVSNLGYVPEVDKRGTSLTYGQTSIPTKGPLAAKNYELDLDQYQYHNGGFFHDDASFTYYIQTKSGFVFADIPEVDQRDNYHDHNNTVQFQYGKNTLYQSAQLNDTFGKEDGQSNNFLTFTQGFFLARNFSAQLAYAREALGSTVTTQTVATGTYRLNAIQTIGGRIVHQSGATDVFFSFSQEVRSGTDIFVLFGDPNANSTVGKLTVKVEHPF